VGHRQKDLQAERLKERQDINSSFIYTL